MEFNVGDKVRIIDIYEGLSSEDGWEGVILGPADNTDDYLVRITDRSKATNPGSAETEAMMFLLCGDDLTYDTASLERIE